MKSFALQEFYKGKEATFYSVIFDGETETETRKFLSRYYGTHTREIQELVAIIQKAADRRGMQDNYCRHEGSYVDGVQALPGRDIAALLGSKPKKNPALRLYILRLSVNTVILYSGGIKSTNTYQEDTVLHQIVKDLQEIENLILDRLKYPYPEIWYSGNDLAGDLSFEVE